MRKWVYGVCALIVIFLGLVLIPVFEGARPALPQTEDLSRMKQLALGLLMYSSDHNDFLPPANWVDHVKDYTRSINELTRCSLLPKDSPLEAHGHVLERGMPGHKLAEIMGPDTVPMLFDGSNLNKNAVDSLVNMRLTLLPGGLSCTIAYADGHVKRNVFQAVERD